LIYFTEIFTRNDIQQVQSGWAQLFNPTGGKIKALQENAFTDTFNKPDGIGRCLPKVGQADAIEPARESSITGTFVDTDNRPLIAQSLIIAYFEKADFEAMVLNTVTHHSAALPGAML